MKAMMWTPEAVIVAAQTLPPIRDDEVLWKKVWMRSVKEFNLDFYMPEPELPYNQWDEEMWESMSTIKVPTKWIRKSSQTDVRLDVLYWYLQDPLAESENFDTYGWFGNDHPVLIALPDGTYVIKDGNHRIISKMLLEDEYVDAYAMRGK